MNVLQFERVSRCYKPGIRVLNDLTLSLQAGDVVGLIGKNGAGKTTLLRVAMGMLAPQQGSVRVFGMDPRKEAVEVKRRIGYVSEEQSLPGFLRVREVIDLHRYLFPSWDRDLETQLIQRFSISPEAKIKTLSKGEARQVALLCSIAHRPELLLLDEPAGGLDPSVRREFLETAIQFLNESGSAILFSSHYMGDIERLAARVAILHQGNILINIPLDELQEQFSLALVPHGVVSARDLLQHEECLAVRERADALHAIVRLEPERARRFLEGRLCLAGSRCQAIPLEEMFIEIVGGLP